MDIKLLEKMRQIAIIISAIITITSCNSTHKININEHDDNVVIIPSDTNKIFKNVQEFSLNSNNIENDSIKITYYSISKKDFFNAMDQNKKNIQVFSKNYKLNEEKAFRKGNQISITNKKDSIQFIDLPLTKQNRPVKYFINGKIGDFFIVKKIEFEDAETYFFDTKNLNLVKKLWGITSSFNNNNSLVFYTNNFFFLPEDKTQLSFIKTDKNKIKYLLNIEVDWFTSFSFFDDKNNLYYIHSFYDENFEIKSTYAKMEYYLKE